MSLLENAPALWISALARANVNARAHFAEGARVL